MLSRELYIIIIKNKSFCTVFVIKSLSVKIIGCGIYYPLKKKVKI